MIERERYLEAQIAAQLQVWVGRVLLLAVVLFVFIGVADYLVTPENFALFFRYRLGISAFLAVLYVLNRRKRNTTYQYTLISIAVIASASVIEAMILHFGGHRSPYYAGQNLVIIAALGLIPFNQRLSIIIAAAIYGIYVVPIVLFDTITDPRTFINNNIFMVSTYLIALTWRLATQKATLNELSLQYDLAQERASLERLVAERTKELNRSEQWHRSLFENATDAILVLDRNGAIVDVNEKACTFHGFPRDALVGTNGSLLEAGPGKELLPERMQRLLGGEALVYETEHYRKDGSRVPLEVSAKAICIEDQIFVQTFLRDMTEKKRIQEHLLQSQKMESIGTLAGGIAHDFNNTLTAIIGYLDVIRRESLSNETVLRVLSIMERAARSAGRMVSQLLGFARKGKVEEASLSMNDAVRETVKLMERVLEGRVTVSLELADELPLMDGDVTQIEQVLMNLIVNARDAMPQGGVITFRTRAAVAGEDAALPPYLPAGRYIVLAVSDTGIGIPDGVRERIFEPFFTTKERGKGTGLGLAMVYGVVTEHHGYIDVQSRPGEGTTFRLFFPVSTGRPALLRRSPSTLKGHETVLVIDDDETVLEFVKETLERNGYTVLGTTNPVSAIDLFSSARERIALVVTDIVMPLIDGGELIGKVRELRPDIRVLTVSAFRGFEDLDGPAGAEAFLQKPFDGKHLLTMVRRVLDAPMPSR